MHIKLAIFDFVRFFGLEASSWYGLILLYLGPETMMPVASFLAGIIGAILIFWQRLVRWMRKLFHHFKSRTRKPTESRKPV